MARPKRGYERFLVKIEPEQAKALREASLRAKLDGLPEAGDGASRIVRELVQAWIDSGARWPGAPSAPPRRRARKPA
jgi:hypothetical protein